MPSNHGVERPIALMLVEQSARTASVYIAQALIDDAPRNVEFDQLLSVTIRLRDIPGIHGARQTDTLESADLKQFEPADKEKNLHVSRFTIDAVLGRIAQSDKEPMSSTEWGTLQTTLEHCRHYYVFDVEKVYGTTWKETSQKIADAIVSFRLPRKVVPVFEY